MSHLKVRIRTIVEVDINDEGWEEAFMEEFECSDHSRRIVLEKIKARFSKMQALCWDALNKHLDNKKTEGE